MILISTLLPQMFPGHLFLLPYLLVDFHHQERQILIIRKQYLEKVSKDCYMSYGSKLDMIRINYSQ